MSTLLERLGIQAENPGLYIGGPQNTSGELVESTNPTTGEVIASVRLANQQDYENCTAEAVRVFREWRMLPAPKRGEIVREMGNALREHKEDLGALVSLEVGKILAEGIGEVQESIDIADFAVGPTIDLMHGSARL